VVDNAKSNTEDEAWKNKVRSVDDNLKSLRGGGQLPKPKASKQAPPEKQQGRGLFSFLHAKPRQIVEVSADQGV
jgi:hypothetical protein